jgi:hypothetical protein
MSLINPNINQNQLNSNISFPQKLGFNIREYLKAIIQPLTILKSVGMGLPNDELFAMSLVKSKLVSIPEVKDFGCVKQNNALNLLAYIDKPNEEVETRIYTIYGEMLDLFPNIDIDLRIVELYGRTKEEMQSYNL